MHLVGRERELQALRELRGRALAGRGALVLLHGEAGIGKSALLRAILGETTVPVGTGLCLGPGETGACGPWLEAFTELGLTGAHLPPPFGGASGEWSHGALAAALVHSLSAAGSALIGLEDLQWADPDSLRLLRAMAPRLDRAPILVVATCREAAFLHDLERGGAQLLPLSRLSPPEVQQLATLSLGAGAEVDSYAARLHRRTGGHPLFVRELLAATARAGLALLQDLPLPESVQQSIERRLQQLPEGALPVLEMAAVLGERFSDRPLADACQGSVADALDAAERQRLVHRSGDAYSFDHALVREVLLAGIAGHRLRQLHRRAAMALLSAPGAASPEALALHLERGGELEPGNPELLLKLGHGLSRSDRDRAARLWGEAARAEDRAVSVWARHLLALRLQRDGDPRCLEEMEEVAAAQEALKDDPAYRRLEVELFGQVVDYPRIAPARALALAKAGRAAEAGEILRSAQAIAKPGTSRTELLNAQYWLAALTGRLSEAVDLGGLVTDEAVRQGDYHLAISSEGNRLYHVLLCKADRPAEVDAVAARLTALLEQARSRYGYSPGDEGVPPLGWYQFLRGDWAGARSNLLGYLERNPHDADPGVRGFAALLQEAMGDLAGARATLAPVPPHEPDEEPSLHTVGVAGYTMRAQLCMDEGAYPRARAYLEGAERCLALRGQVSFRSPVQMGWARYFRETGDPQRSYTAAAEAVTLAREPLAFRYLIIACTLLGEAAAGLGRPAEAEKHFGEAEGLASRCNFPYYVEQVRLARVRSLGEVPNPRAGRLSDRELQVTSLVAEGLTDKEIGARLHISPRTVDNHLRNIFGKVGVNSRAALAAYFVRQN